MRTRITRIEQLEQYRGKCFRVSRDGGKTWFYVKLPSNEVFHRFNDGGEGYNTVYEVTSDGVHGNFTITDKLLKRERKLRIVPATEAEVRGKKWSYNR